MLDMNITELIILENYGNVVSYFKGITKHSEHRDT